MGEGARAPRSTGSEAGFAPVDGGRLHFEKLGDGGAIVLLHGFALDLRIWDDQFERLARDYLTIRYDLRGFGRSSAPAGAPYSHAGDLERLLEHLGVERAHLVGMSLGGTVSIDFALRKPESVRSLTLISSGLAGYRRRFPAADSVLKPVYERAREAGPEAAKGAWLGGPLFRPAMERPELRARLSAIVGGYSGWHFANRDAQAEMEPPAAAR